MKPALALLLWLAGCAPEPGPEPLTVFAAASMTEVAGRLADAHERETGQPVRVSIGATSTLARQIEACGPADVLLAPRDDWMNRLITSGYLGSVRNVADGALAVVVAETAEPWTDLQHVTTMDRLALADPAHVPAGRFARAALVKAGLWDAVAPRVVPLPNVRAALVAVASGQAEAAIVYESDLGVSDRVQEAVSIPDSLQPEIVFICAATVRGETRRADQFCGRDVLPSPGLRSVSDQSREETVRVIGSRPSRPPRCRDVS